MALWVASVVSTNLLCRKTSFSRDRQGIETVRQVWTCQRRHYRSSSVCLAATQREANDAEIDFSNGALSTCRVVLVSPQRPGNVGAVARLCANHECGNLWVVNPSCDVLAEEAVMFAATAVGWQLLRAARVVPSLAEALHDCNAAVGFSRRVGQRRLPSLHVGQLAQLARRPEQERWREQEQDQERGQQDGEGEEGGFERAPLKAANRQTLALVFGREDIGLLTEELAMCSHVCELATGRWQPSLNLSQACAVALSRLYEGVVSPRPPLPLLPPASQSSPSTMHSASDLPLADGSRELGGAAPATPPPGSSMTPHPCSSAFRSLPGSATLAEVDSVIWRWEQTLAMCTDACHSPNDALGGHCVASATVTPTRVTDATEMGADDPGRNVHDSGKVAGGGGCLDADHEGECETGEGEGDGKKHGSGAEGMSLGATVTASRRSAGDKKGGGAVAWGDPGRTGAAGRKRGKLRGKERGNREEMGVDGDRGRGGDSGDNSFVERFVPQMRRLLLRSNVSKRELQFLHGFLSMVQKALRTQGTSH